MLNRSLEKNVSLELENDVSLNCKDTIVLEYYIFESELNNAEEFIGKKSYGIEIVKTTNGKFIEMECIKNYSTFKEGTLEFLDKLARNSVTPVGLPYVFDDFFGI